MARNSFGDLARTMRAIREGIDEGMEQTIKSAATIGVSTAIFETPVDTGKARSNWRVTIGGPASDVRPPYFAGRRLGKDENANAAQALQVAKAAIAGFRRGANRGMFITNNVDYIVKLDQGSSGQSPEGMSDKAEMATIDEVERRVVAEVFKRIDAAVLRT